MTCTREIKAQRLKRVFNIDITTCEECGGTVKVIAEASDRSIEDPTVIRQIFAHLERKAESKEFNPLPRSRVSDVPKIAIPLEPPEVRFGGA